MNEKYVIFALFDGKIDVERKFKIIQKIYEFTDDEESNKKHEPKTIQ